MLGPVLFLLHIADIASNVSAGTSVSSYVDDTRVQRRISDVSQDCKTLQEDLQTIYAWADRVNMTFNSDKFECVRYWPRDSQPDHHYQAPDSNIIEQKDHLRDLGVEISSDLKFSDHISNVASSASMMVGWCMRTFRRRSETVMMTIWKSLIQPKLDYCSQLWSPSDQASIAMLEGIQRNFTSRIAGMEGKDYMDRLLSLRLYSQERRRERYQVIFLWKISQGLVQGYDMEFKNFDRRLRMAVPHPVTRDACATVRRARESSLGVKGARIFNLLPAWIRTLNGVSVSEFKCELDRFLAGVPDQPTCPGRQRAAATNSLLDQLQLIF